MGLFSSKKTVVVSSTVYNLAGDFIERPDFLKTTVAAGLLGPGSSNRYMGTHLVDEMFAGPAMRQRRFQQWSRSKFTIGLPKSSIVKSLDIGAVDYTPYITVPVGSSIEVLSASAELADFFYWAEQYLLEYDYAGWLLEWTADYSSITGEITITFPDTSTTVITPTDYVQGEYYIYVHYTLVTPVSGFLDTRAPRLWIYQVGSGTAALDSSVTIEAESTEYMPFIPLRLKNTPINDDHFKTAEPIYEDCRRAYKQALGIHARIDDLLDTIEDNESIDDVDYCFMVYGVPLNTEDNASRRYLYEYFKRLIPYQGWSVADYNAWASNTVKDFGTLTLTGTAGDPATITFTGQLYGITAGMALQLTLADESTEDITVSSVSYDGGSDTTTWNVTPTTTAFAAQLVGIKASATNDIKSSPATNTIRVNTSDDDSTSYDMQITWVLIDETSHNGLGKVGAKAGDVWLEKGTAFTYSEESADGVYNGGTLDAVIINYQTSTESYRTLTITGLEHKNFVYKDKKVKISGVEALEETDESGFIVPIHMPTLKKISFLRASQLAGNNALLVFNSYEVVKTKWYQSGIFKILLIVVAIAVTIILTVVTAGPGGIAAAGGILGSNLAVGTALGISGLAAAVAGAVANAIAAMVLTMILTKAATALLGEQVGMIVGMVLSVVAIQGLSNFQLTGSLTVNWGDIATADNLLKLTSAVAKSYQSYAQDKIEGYQEKLVDLEDDYRSQQSEIDKLSAELLGYSGVIIDPLSFTNVLDTSTYRVESNASFLNRTLLTGSDIAEISLGMISEFPRLSLELPKYTL